MAENTRVSSEETDVTSLDTLDKFIEQTQPLGSINKAIGNNLYGINHRKIKGVLPENRDDFGYTFFTRPQLNLKRDNLRNFRAFYPLLTSEPLSVHRYVRTMLDPRLMHRDPTVDTHPDNKSHKTPLALQSPLVDPEMAFIPILTNTLKSVSGWPDIVMSSFTTTAGVRKEQWTIADGTTDIFEAFDLDVTFRNTKSEPSMLLFSTWLQYQGAVFEGMCSPYMDFITENEIDYNTRIYRLIMDETNTVVKKISATGASFPISVPSGKFFDYSDERKYSDQTKDLTIRFRSMGAMYNDDILVKEFNDTVGIFNPSMRKLNEGVTGHGMEKIPKELLNVLNYRGYPRIDTDTYELEWYVKSEEIIVNDSSK